jgi:hypothetical protein
MNSVQIIQVPTPRGQSLEVDSTARCGLGACDHLGPPLAAKLARIRHSRGPHLSSWAALDDLEGLCAPTKRPPASEGAQDVSKRVCLESRGATTTLPTACPTPAPPHVMIATATDLPAPLTLSADVGHQQSMDLGAGVPRGEGAGAEPGSLRYRSAVRRFAKKGDVEALGLLVAEAACALDGGDLAATQAEDLKLLTESTRPATPESFVQFVQAAVRVVKRGIVAAQRRATGAEGGADLEREADEERGRAQGQDHDDDDLAGEWGEGEEEEEEEEEEPTADLSAMLGQCRDLLDKAAALVQGKGKGVPTKEKPVVPPSFATAPPSSVPGSAGRSQASAFHE